jgi:hypothetical protein
MHLDANTGCLSAQLPHLNNHLHRPALNRNTKHQQPCATSAWLHGVRQVLQHRGDTSLYRTARTTH